jgi:hypothetical protein
MPGNDDAPAEQPKQPVASVRYDSSNSAKRRLADFCKSRGVTDVETLRTISNTVDGMDWTTAEGIASGICKDATDLKNIFPIDEEKQS